MTFARFETLLAVLIIVGMLVAAALLRADEDKRKPAAPAEVRK